MKRRPETAWRRHCPVCADGEIALSVWDMSRKRVRRCPECGSRIEFVVPAWPYYLMLGFNLLLWSMAPLLLLAFWIPGLWRYGIAGMLLSLALVTSANFLFSRFLVARREGEIPPEDIGYKRRFPESGVR